MGECGKRESVRKREGWKKRRGKEERKKEKRKRTVPSGITRWRSNTGNSNTAPHQPARGSEKKSRGAIPTIPRNRFQILGGGERAAVRGAAVIGNQGVFYW